MRVYIAGPYTQGDTTANVRRAMKAGLFLMVHNFAVHVPHLYHFMELQEHHDYEFWLKHDLKWLEACTHVLRLSGHSPGADREVDRARALNLEIFHGTPEEFVEQYSPSP